MRIDGLLIVDKPEGITSLEVVRRVKRRFSIKKAGHIGTLDPFATGILPVVINEGTKLVPFLEEDPKEYEGVMRLGEETTTGDLTGEVVRKGSFKGVTSEMVRALFKTFQGRIQQTPPMFSAVKVRGKPLYRLARKGIEIERKAREVEIFDIEVQEINLPEVRFRVSCSKGTYIRALAKDIGKEIGCGAHLVLLRRIRSGSFTLKQAISLDKLMMISGMESLQPWLVSLREALPSLPEVIGDDSLVKKIRFGKEMLMKDLSSQPLPAFGKGQWLKMSYPEEGLVAILKWELKGGETGWANPEKAVLHPLRVFHPEK